MKSFQLHTLIFFIGLQFGAAQSLSPAGFLATIPQPPKTLATAFKRCPNESDTLAAKAIAAMKSFMLNEHASLKNDSLKIAHGKQKLSQAEIIEIQKLQHETTAETESLATQLQQLTGEAAKGLLNEIRVIGEALDKEIKNCPKVGDKQILDSACVEGANYKANASRRDASHRFLRGMQEGWMLMFEATLEKLSNREKHISELIALSKKPEFILRLRRIGFQMWGVVEQLLKSVDQTTRLATQFSR